MEIAYTEEQQALKAELRAYYQNLLTPELEEDLSHANGVGPVVRKVVKQMGTDGWLGIGWPEPSGAARGARPSSSSSSSTSRCAAERPSPC